MKTVYFFLIILLALLALAESSSAVFHPAGMVSPAQDVSGSDEAASASSSEPLAQEGVYPCVADTQIAEGAATTSYGNATSLKVDGQDGDIGDKHTWALLRFDVSSIAANCTVNSASLRLHITDDGTDNIYQVFKITALWDDAVTWSTFATPQPKWDTSASQGTAGTFGTDFQNIPLAASLVRGWVNSPATNYGFIIADWPSGTNTSGFVFDSEDAGENGPQLTVNYTCTGVTMTSFQDGVAPHANYAGTRDTQISEGNPAIFFGAKSSLVVDGSDTNQPTLNKPSWSLLKWDLSRIPANTTVTAASVTLYITNASGGQQYHLYEVTGPWNEWSVNFNSKPAWNSTRLGTLAPTTTGTDYPINLTADGVAVVQRWLNQPATNYGFIIADDANSPDGVSSDGIDFISRESQIADKIKRPKLTLTHSGSLTSAYIVNGPVVQHPTDGSVDLIWETNVSTSGKVRFRRLGGDWSSWNTSLSQVNAGYSGKWITTAMVNPGNWTAGAIYEYQLSVDNGSTWWPARPLTFQLGRWYDDGVLFKMVAYGDTRATEGTTSTTEHHSAVAQSILRSNPEVVLNSGDFVDKGKCYDDWPSEYFQPVQDLLARKAVLPVPGNHEYNTRTGCATTTQRMWYEDYFTWQDWDWLNTPTRETWHADTYGCVRVVGLDTYQTFTNGSDQYRWLEKELKSELFQWARWQIVFMHHAPYNCGASHFNDQENALIRRDLVPLFEKYGVDAVISGHSHNYERAVKNGIQYIVSGGGGTGLNDFVNPIETCTGATGYGAVRQNGYKDDWHHLTLDVTCVGEPKVVIRSVLPNDTVFETVNLLPTVSAFNVNTTAETVDGVCDTTNCSLRDAIMAANRNPGHDTIVLPQGDFVLTLGPPNNDQGTSGDEDAATEDDLDVTANVTIRGQGTSNTSIKNTIYLDAFEIHPSATEVRFEDLTIKNLPTSGPPYWSGIVARSGKTKVYLTRVKIEQNQYGYAGAMGTLFLEDVEVTGGHYGVAGDIKVSKKLTTPIFKNARVCIEGVTVELRDSIVSGCGAGLVGAELDVYDTTFTQNTDGIHLYGTDGTKLKLTRATIKNSSHDGISVDFSGFYMPAFVDLDVISATISDNQGAGISITGSGTPWGGFRVAGYSNLTMANNVEGDYIIRGTLPPEIIVPFYSNSLSIQTGVQMLRAGDECRFEKGNLVGTSESCRVDEFTNDDGLPGHGHYPLLPGSPAIDAATGGCPATDQLGHPRTDGDGDGIAGCDIGAIEYQPPAPGDCNADKSIDAIDLSATVREIFDHDGNLPKNAPFGTFAGTIACDSDQSRAIDAVDLSCTVRRIFGKSCPRSQTSAPAGPADPARLSLPAQTFVRPGGAATLPLTLSVATPDVGALAFSLDYDQRWLRFDPTDADGDGLPDALRFTLPSGFTPIVLFDPTDATGEIDIALLDASGAFAPLPAGTLATITFTAASPEAPVQAAVTFASDPPPAFAGVDGQSREGQALGGIVAIGQPVLYLPLLSR